MEYVPMKRDLHRGDFARWPAIVMAISICLAFGSQNAPAVSLLYQWDFNGPSGNTMAPTTGIGGVLTMSRVTVGDFGLSPPPLAISAPPPVMAYSAM